MKLALVFRMEGLDGKTYAYKPSVLNNTSDEVKAGVKSLALKRHGLKYDRFMELYHDELEAQGLLVKPEEEQHEETGRTKK